MKQLGKLPPNQWKEMGVGKGLRGRLTLAIKPFVEVHSPSGFDLLVQSAFAADSDPEDLGGEEEG